jgi:hypothetical protein
VLDREQVNRSCVLRLPLQHLFYIGHAGVMVAGRARVQGKMKILLGVEHGVIPGVSVLASLNRNRPADYAILAATA